MKRDDLKALEREHDRWDESDRLTAGICRRYPKALRRDALIDEIESLGVMHMVEEVQRNVLLVGGRFYYFNESTQWRHKGSQVYYPCRDFTAFWELVSEDFVIRGDLCTDSFYF